MTKPAQPVISPATAAVRLIAVFVILVLAAAWATQLWQGWDNPETLNRDWTAFHRAGRLLWDGQSRDIYPGSFDAKYPFLYPPFFVYACAAIGWMPAGWAYAACIALAILALAGAILALKTLLPGRSGDYATVTLVVLASAPWNGLVVVGQISSLFLLLIVAGFLAWRRGRPMLAGAVFALLAIKPNLGVIFAIVCIAKGQWRMLGGMALATAILLLTTLPLGIGVWQDYLAASSEMAVHLKSGSLDIWKHQTLFAFWQGTLGIVLSPRWLQVLWGASIVPLVLATGAAWRGKLDPSRLPRLLAITVLLVVACNPYVYFYDGLLLMIPGIVWYVDRRGYASTRCHRLAGIALVVAYAWQHLSLWVLKGGWPLVGVAVSIWLLIEVYDLTFAPRRPRHDEPAPDRTDT